MIVLVNVTDDGQVGNGWGKAPRVAVADVTDGAVSTWTVHDVAWDVLHGDGCHGSHHERIETFVREQGADVVVTGHMGPPMQQRLSTLGVRLVLDATGDARAAAVAAATA